ncbi:MAG: recombination mediator RecR [Elusimicrobiota bacterium]
MKSFEKLVQSLKRLPGIGPKQAERLATHIVRAPVSEAERLASALREARSKVRACRICLNYTESEECRLCADPGRDRSFICVVEQPADVNAIERSQSFNGVYHVLHGRLSPLHGVGPEGIRVPELIARVKNGERIREVLLATDPDTEGEATALYLAGLLKDLPVRVTRIAQGVPMGAHLDYMDEATISCALKSRREFTGE